jgi:hypothetical protein
VCSSSRRLDAAHLSQSRPRFPFKSPSRAVRTGGPSFVAATPESKLASTSGTTIAWWDSENHRSKVRWFASASATHYSRSSFIAPFLLPNYIWFFLLRARNPRSTPVPSIHPSIPVSPSYPPTLPLRASRRGFERGVLPHWWVAELLQLPLSQGLDWSKCPCCIPTAASSSELLRLAHTPTALSSVRNAPPASPPSPLLCRQAPVKSPSAAPPHLPPPT